MDFKVEYILTAVVGLFSIACLKILLSFFRKVENPCDDVISRDQTTGDDVITEDKNASSRRRKGGVSQRKMGGGSGGDKGRRFSHDWLVCSLKGHSGTVLDAQFSADAKYLASCADDGQKCGHSLDLDDRSQSGPPEATEEQSPTHADALTDMHEYQGQVVDIDDGDKQSSPLCSSSSSSPCHQKAEVICGQKALTSSPAQRRQRQRKKHTKKKVQQTPSVGDTSKQQCEEFPPVSVPLSDDELYHVLCQYTVPLEQLAVLGFPQACGVRAGRAYVYRVTRQSAATSHRLLDVAAKEFVPRSLMVASEGYPVESSGASLKKCGSDSGFTEEEDKSTSSSASSSLTSLYAKDDNCSSVADCIEIGSEYKTIVSDGSASDSSSSSSLIDTETDSSSSSFTDTSSSTSSPPPPASDVSRLPGSGVVWPACARCNHQFGVTLAGVYLPSERRQCVFHWGKLQLKHLATGSAGSGRHWRHCCCDGRPGSRGCSVASDHVWTGLLPGLNGPLRGYVFSRQPRLNYYSHQRPTVLALDCEMCFSGRGMQLARVSVVDIRGRRVYDSLVQPEHPVLDYNTRFSGMTPRRLATATRSLRAVQSDLLGFIVADTILVGHGLENDLRALRLVHSHVIDTSTLFVHARGLPYRHKLSDLVASCLGRSIQTAAGGHDSLQDARACMQLLLWRVRQDMGLGAAN